MGCRYRSGKKLVLDFIYSHERDFIFFCVSKGFTNTYELFCCLLPIRQNKKTKKLVILVLWMRYEGGFLAETSGPEPQRTVHVLLVNEC